MYICVRKTMMTAILWPVGLLSCCLLLQTFSVSFAHPSSHGSSSNAEKSEKSPSVHVSTTF
jgi:hypothetical protein